MVFDVTAAPRDRAKFLTWYERQSEWEESHGYKNPDIPAQALKEWFREIIKTFPLNLAEYSLGRYVIYVSFAWSEAEAAYKQVKQLAAKHGVGFFDVSGTDGDIWWPNAEWKLTCESRDEIPLPLDLSFGEVLNKLDPKINSFFVLEHVNGNYMQCGGSKAACTVEFREYDGPTKYKHHVIGQTDGSTATATIKMSAGSVSVQKGEVFTAVEAAELFELFFAGNKFPKKYSLREKEF
jgi:hypothetical protein